MNSSSTASMSTSSMVMSVSGGVSSVIVQFAVEGIGSLCGWSDDNERFVDLESGVVLALLCACACFVACWLFEHLNLCHFWKRKCGAM